MKNLTLLAIIFFGLSLHAQTLNQFDTVGAHTKLKVYPQFPGDKGAFYTYIFDGTKKLLQSNQITDIISANVIIEVNGKIKYIKITKHANSELDLATIYLLKHSPKWNPGYDYSGRPVRTQMPLCLDFRIIKEVNENIMNGPLIANDGGESVDDTGPDRIYTAVEVQPQFPGDFIKFIKTNKKLPKKYSKTTGRVIAQFVVERDGSLNNIKILRGPSDIFNAEALRILKKSPNWIPGFENGVPVRSYYTVPITLGQIYKP